MNLVSIFYQVLACMAGYGALFDQVNSDGNTPLHNAAASGAGMCVKFLGQRGKVLDTPFRASP
jgi:ankyrin repeat protein